MEELSRDPALADALRELDPPPSAEVDWDRLRASVAARAELPLARRRGAGRRRAARWLGMLVPAAAAAGLALAVLPQGARAPGAAPPADSAVPAPRPLVDEVVDASYPAGYLERLISGSADADALLLAAVGDPEAARP